MKKIISPLTVVATMFCLSGFIAACNSSSTTQSADSTKMKTDSSKTMSMNQSDMKKDSQNVVDLITANYDEIKILQLALTKSIPVDLKTNTQMMLKDHQKAIDDLSSLASKKNYAVPNGVDSDGVHKYNDLNKENGKSFEKNFLSWAISVHKDAISKCQDIIKNSHDSDLVSWCNGILPTLQNHLQMAQTAQNNLK